MVHLTLLLMLLPQVVSAEASPEGTQKTAVDEGPLRLEITAMREIRFSAEDPDIAARMRSELGMQVRVAGERIGEVVRHGNVVFTEVVDDTGKVLAKEADYTEEDRTATRTPMFPPERLEEDGLVLTTRVEPSARGATKMARIRGYIRLILAKESVHATVINPFQFLGKQIEDPRLAQYGVDIEVVPVDQIENAPPADRCIVFRYLKKGEHVNAVKFYDGWMRQQATRDTWVKTKEGEQVHMHYFDARGFNDELQAVFEIHPEVEDMNLQIEMNEVALP